MAALTSAALKFTVRRRPAVLVPPAAPMPRELKRLSDIDDQDGLRYHVPVILSYRRNASMDDGQDPALVHYHPFAGRLRELERRKLAVDCTGEGILFIEADADVRLDHFGDAVHPPFPCYEELLFDVPGSSAVLNSPLFLIQVTRLACGGFILAVRMHHAMADAQGMVQFLGAVAELARGAAPAPSVPPVWARELLSARDPPRPSFPHREYDDDVEGAIIPPLDADTAQRSFFFGPREVAAIRDHLLPDLRRRATAFGVVTGSVWKCRTTALASDAAGNEETRLICVVSARGGGGGKTGAGLGIRIGYYGNAFATPVAISTAGELCRSPVSYPVELVKQANEQVDAEYVRSVSDLMVLRRRPRFALARAYMVSDLTRAGNGDIDYGWGRPMYAPAARGTVVSSFFGPMKNAKGEDGIIVLMCLPGASMDKFAEEVGKLLRQPPVDGAAPQQRGVFQAKMSVL